MKKIALTSLLAVVAVSGAHAANVIDGNPLYRPTKGHFYSETALLSHSENADTWALGEEFGYGITDRLSVNVKTDVVEYDSFDGMAWDDFEIGLNYRVLSHGAWRADVYGAYALAPVWGDHESFLDADVTGYTWLAGIRGGYQTYLWTVAGHFEFAYAGSESFNWGDEGAHRLSMGIDGQYVLCNHLNLVAGLEYSALTDEWAKNSGTWIGTFGVNYNIDATKYVGAFVNGGFTHESGDWEWADGIGFGVKFGIDF